MTMSQISIALDVSPLRRKNISGIGRVAKELSLQLSRYSEFEIFAQDFYGDKEIVKDHLSFLDDSHIKKSLIPAKISYLLWNMFPFLHDYFYGKKDVAVSFNYLLPKGKNKKIVFVHDMVLKRFPETMKFLNRLILKYTLKHTCKKADLIITVSEFGKKEITTFFNVSPEKIKVVPNSIDKNIFHNNYTNFQIKDVSEKYKIDGDYFLYVGTLEPRKNLVGLINAYFELLKKQTNVPKLVIAGNRGWQYSEIFETVKKNNIENMVIFTDYVEEADLPKLMCGAFAFVFPSFYEGFGLPPLEAMACGTPVITSNTASLPEVVGDAAILVDPYNIKDIADAMNVLINDKERYLELVQKGFDRIKNFDWEKSGKIFVQSIKNILKSR